MEPRLVAVGRKYPAHKTVYVSYSIGDIGWKPQRDPNYQEPDYDEIRKTRLEMIDPEDIG